MIKEGDVVLCTVKKIEGTTVFLDIEGGGEGSMTFSEVAPGRIRNIREYVVANKKVVCKILRISTNHIELSLRRVTGGDREAVMKRYKKELTLESMLKSVVKDKARAILAKINETMDAVEFLDQIKDNPKLIVQLVSKAEAEALEKVFAEKRDKKKQVKHKIFIKSQGSSGIEDIRAILESDATIYYLGSSTFQIITEDADVKKADNKMEKILKEMREKAKACKAEFEVK